MKTTLKANNNCKSKRWEKSTTDILCKAILLSYMQIKTLEKLHPWRNEKGSDWVSE